MTTLTSDPAGAMSEVTNGAPAAHPITNGTQPKKVSKRSRGRKKGRKDISRAEELFGEKPKEEAPSDVEIIYVPQEMEIEETDPLYDDFKNVFDRFTVPDQSEDEDKLKAQDEFASGFRKATSDSDESEESDEDGTNTSGISRKKLRKLNRMSISELKQRSKKPEVVEWVDVTASDPTLLVHLKGCRNSVPVPKHWCQKRKYLQGKRGIEKPPFELPAFIKDTGIMEMRQAAKDKEDHAKAKTKARDRVQPRMGKLDIDYQRLHDAFFRFQTKPHITKHGELYYEGKDLKAALNIPPLAPPPWLINMQRYGPPPSYPNILIPGLNAPIPEGAMWGYHPGGWGKPPVDEFNRPLYGDVFGNEDYTAEDEIVEPVDRTLWGDLVSDEEVVEEEEEEEEDDDEEDEDEPVETVVDMKEGMATPSGLVSVASGLETPQEIELRKDARNDTNQPKRLYHVLPQKETSAKGQFMGSQYTYDTGAILGQEADPKRRRKMDGVEVALDPNEVNSLADKAYLASRYEGAIQERNADIAKEDLGDMVAEHAAEQERRRRSKTGKDVKESSKDKKKGFKF
ncbi:hypothetical protein DSO57_1039069 [Entomophthora muscae]|uniref:Uncharacterized protein n=1 Tax=Entomophthora muscae TaxID=34485 RepID=A0ACC2SZB2_9FUNG|nr:hypothetical protein DSO57_1039069 [Entomophthora muscae]